MAVCKFAELRAALCCSRVLLGVGVALVLGACSDSGETEPAAADSANSGNGGSDTSGNAAGAGGGASGSAAPSATPTSPEPGPVPSSTPGESTSIDALNPTRASFRDPDSSFVTQDVHDAEREVVHFDLEREAMVAGSGELSVSGWATDGNELRWSRSGVAFRVRFGTEQGERRAYFTEAGNGTICNLEIAGPDTLRIFATSEVPPQ